MFILLNVWTFGAWTCLCMYALCTFFHHFYIFSTHSSIILPCFCVLLFRGLSCVYPSRVCVLCPCPCHVYVLCPCPGFLIVHCKTYRMVIALRGGCSDSLLGQPYIYKHGKVSHIQYLLVQANTFLKKCFCLFISFSGLLRKCSNDNCGWLFQRFRRIHIQLLCEFFHPVTVWRICWIHLPITNVSSSDKTHASLFEHHCLKVLLFEIDGIKLPSWGEGL